MHKESNQLVTGLENIANRLRIHSIKMTSEAGSGHPTSSLSAADIVSTLFFHVMRYDPHHISYLDNDELVLSKGHAAPVLYAALAEAGIVPVTELGKLRKHHALLEGHPVPGVPGVRVATGSLGQGLAIGMGMAYAMKLDRMDYRVYVLSGDGEMAEGSVWEAANFAPHLNLDNLCAILDMNRLGQSGPTMPGWDTDFYRSRFDAFGWYTVVVDGHNISELLDAFSKTREKKQPVCIIAKTVKGKGVSFLEDKEGFHGQALTPDRLQKAIDELEGVITPVKNFTPANFTSARIKGRVHAPLTISTTYSKGEQVATRQAYGHALVKLGRLDEHMVVLDGDVKNSTYTEYFFKAYPDRSIQCYIAEQNMVGLATGLQAKGKRPFLATFAAFLTRAHDQIRVAAYSQADLKIAGSHTGVSIGEDGPSQMGLEDVALFRATYGSVVLSPADGVAAEKLTCLSANHQGLSYVRTVRPKTPVIYENNEEFSIGGSKLLMEAPDAQVTIIASGITVHEALKAAETLYQENILVNVVDCYSIKPLDSTMIRHMAQQTKKLITVEDHYVEGGLGEAVAREAAGLAEVLAIGIIQLPHSGLSKELLQAHGLDHTSIEKYVKSLLDSPL